MNEQPDKFFRDKLYNYEKPASHEAWQRVSHELNKTNKGTLWLKIAAAILVLSLAFVFIFTIRFNDPENITLTNAASSEKEKPAALEIPPSPDQSAGENLAIDKSKRKDDSEKNIRRQVPRQFKVEKKQERGTPMTSLAEIKKTTPIETLPPMQEPEPFDNGTAQVESVPGNPDTETKPRSVTIVFSAKEVNEKYLTKKTGTGATSAEKESSTFKKVLDKAYDLTHNQDPMGELRQKKNEILAMNFNNDKQRDEND